MLIKQISIFLENRAGQLSGITRCLADKGIDLRAICIAETLDYGVVRIISNNNHLAIEALKEEGFILMETPVIVAAVADEPGGLAKMLDIMAKEEIDIEYMYSIFSQANDKAMMVFKVADPERLESILQANGYKDIDEKDLGF